MGYMLRQSRNPCLPENEFRYGPAVVDRFCIRHAGHCGETSGHCGFAAALDRFLVLVARLPQVGVDINEARYNQAVRHIQRLPNSYF